VKHFEIPNYYKSNLISKIKKFRGDLDPRKKNISPTKLDFGPVRFFIARHFGFCFGVENAIEIAYKTIEENPGKRVFLLSEMIHNPGVNDDLINRGIKFIFNTSGRQLIDWDKLNKEDIILIPAFGTTIEIERMLREKGLFIEAYDTTCPFVEKVWNRSHSLGEQGYTIIIHGKYFHEETRATFSHSVRNAPAIIVRDLKETKILCSFILGKRSKEEFYEFFKGRISIGFNFEKDLAKLGVVNQTTMLASETQEIADYIKDTMTLKYGKENLKDHYADTSDTLCYATYDNQEATYGLLEQPADFAIVVGGYNSSNTTHIVELCEKKIKTYFISSEEKIISDKQISHFDIHHRKEIETENYIPKKDKVDILLTSGASCPDAVVDRVLQKIHSYFQNTLCVEDVLNELFKSN
jgi:4-hydroxy-3-methylbut-2-enyl diphosphate reductase